jgi:hypothetical protein
MKSLANILLDNASTIDEQDFVRVLSYIAFIRALATLRPLLTARSKETLPFTSRAGSETLTLPCC